MDGNQSEEEKNGNEKDFYKEFQDLVLDLNLDQATADEAWSNYETLKLRYVMEGCQMYWVACSVYFSCRQRKLPTVGGRPGTTVQGNCISLTRLLHFCNLTMVEFIRKMRLWLKMTHLDSDCVEFVDTLERKFAVSNNIYRKYRPIFLDLFVDPENDVPRPVRSRKQRKPPCNATELYQFSWTLYILVKARYPGITQDLVMSYFLLLSCIDLIYVNVKCMSRTDLLNPTCEGYPKLRENKSAIDVVKLPESIMDYLCRKFEGVVVETKVVRDYYWKPDIRKLVETKLLKGSTNGLCLLECQHFDHNVKEVRNAYEANLLTSGEFDDRMFLTNDKVLGLPDSGASSPVPTAPVTPMPHLPKRGLMLPGDYHLMPQTPLSGRQGALESPCNPGHKRQYSPLAAAATALQRLYSLINGRTTGPSPALASMLARVSPDPMPVIQELLTEMGTRFCKLYCEEAQEAGSTSPAALPKSCSLPESQSSEDSAVQDGGRPLEHCSSTGSIKSSSNYGVSLAFAKMRLKTAQMLFFTFLENIIQDDETKRGIDINVIVKQSLFIRTLFVCSVELVLTCYNDPRRFPWSLQVGNVPAYHLVRIIEPVVRSELQCDNRLSRDLVKHLKRIEEQILDLLAWQSNSPLWTILEEDSRGLPSCKDVNFSHFLDTADRTSKVVNGSAAVNGESGGATGQPLAPPSAAGGTSVIMSPAGNRAAQLNKPYSSPRQSPLSSAANERLALQSPPAGSKGSVKRTLLFPSDTAPQKTPSITAPSSPSTVVVRPPTSDAAAPHQPTPSVTLRLVPDPPKLVEEESSGERPRRHGSLALFFRKVYNVANLRLGDLCDRLQIDSELRRKIWTCLENSIIHHSHLLKDRHLDQLIMCAIYIVCKVTGNDRIFQDIMKQYRCQPQADSLIYRSVLIRRLSATTGEPEESDDSSSSTSRNKCLPPTGLTPVCDSNASSSRSSKRTNLLPWKVNGTSTSFKKEERGDLIRFYNHVYVQEIKTFALKFKPNNQDGLTPHLPPLSPVPMVRATPVSPRRRISSSRPVFVHSLSPATSAAAASPRRPLPYFFNWSPNKNLRAINSLVHLRASNNNNNNNNSSSSSPYKRRLSPTEDSSNKRLMRGISRRLSTVLDDRQKTSDSGLPESASLPGSLSHSGDGGNLIITNGDGGEVNSVVGVPMEHDENTPVVGGDHVVRAQQIRRC